ncbi:ABC transporter ATP-binding protein [Priestia taiwanensis]|uniref:Peptide ABC transporter ATP-binding protein n=1 Tax=Priestia taiwanensis TaxID=1347902 RepID=A0A917ELA5_9BACI|nr:ABC transporter ATP-binding protein [Priestia taiwanensis]MBM7361770.1 peptide/nickel transport system ATP-binding protein [Priestia taiwanensis]GGE56863.1 peptide ABC transporter ATP-binding protein [Priestia taiwanensis]
MAEKLLEIKDLKTSFRIKDDYYAAVDNVSITLYENEIVAIVGESGCGKSALALSIMGLHNKERTKLEGEILYKDKNLIKVGEKELNKVRGNHIGMVFQEPLTALNPLMTVGQQIEENLDYHTTLSKADKKERTLQLLDQVGIPRPELTYKQYPHELSGGMRQRIVIAIAIACNPSVLIADEPTTALDVTIQAQILDLLKEIQSETKMSVVLITHDLSVVAEMADRVIVMYAGQVVEHGLVEKVFRQPLHPYTRSLFQSIPTVLDDQERLHVIQGTVPSILKLDRKGCRFHPRIPWVSSDQHEENPTLHEAEDGHWVRCTCYKNFYFENSIEGDSHDITQSK